MSYTRPQLCTPWTITASAHLRVMLGFSGVLGAPAEVSATASTVGTYYNARNFSDSTELVKQLIDKLAAGEAAAGTNGTWSCAETSSGDYPGIFKIKRERAHANDVVTKLQFIADIPGSRLGYSEDSFSPDEGVGLFENVHFTAQKRAEGLWIMDNATAHYSGDEVIEVSHAVSTTSPDGTTVTNNWGDISRWSAFMQTMSAASVFKHYVDQSDYASIIGAPTGDENACLDTLRKLLTRVDQGKYARWYGDYATLSSFIEISPSANEDKWISSLSGAISGQVSQPRMFDISLSAYKS